MGNAIQDALARGVSDEAIVATIVRETGVPETEAKQVLAQEKGLPREEWDDVIDSPAADTGT